MKSFSVTIQMKATKQFFPVMLFIMLHKVVLTFESVDEILKCDHSSCSAEPFYRQCCLFFVIVQNEIWGFLKFLLWVPLVVGGLLNPFDHPHEKNRNESTLSGFIFGNCTTTEFFF